MRSDTKVRKAKSTPKLPALGDDGGGYKAFGIAGIQTVTILWIWLVAFPILDAQAIDDLSSHSEFASIRADQSWYETADPNRRRELVAQYVKGKTWAEVVSMPWFRALSPSERESVRKVYFDVVVVPVVPSEHLEMAWAKFDRDTNPMFYPFAQQTQPPDETTKVVPWEKVAEHAAAKELNTEEYDQLRKRYFERVIAPNLPLDQIDAGWKSFEERTRRRHSEDASAWVPVLISVVILGVLLATGWRLWISRSKLVTSLLQIATLFSMRYLWLWAALICIGLLLHPPYHFEHGTDRGGFDWIWDIQKRRALIDYAMLITLVAGVVLVAGLLFAFSRTHRRD